MESAFQYADQMLPKVFSESNSLVLHYRDLISQGGFLNADHLVKIQDVYREELGDLHTLWSLVSQELTKQSSDIKQQSQVELEEIKQKFELYFLSIKTRLQEVLHATSVWVPFFENSIRFFEEYEATSGNEPIPKDQQEQISVVLQQDYRIFLQNLDAIMKHGKTAIRPIDRDFVSEFNRLIEGKSADVEDANETFELGKIALERAVSAELYRKELQILFQAFENCFAILSRRALAHGVKISMVQLLK